MTQPGSPDESEGPRERVESFLNKRYQPDEAEHPAECPPVSTEKRRDNPIDFRKATLICGVSVFLGLVFNYLFYNRFPGIGFPVYILLVVAGTFVIFSAFKKEVGIEARWLLVPAIFFSAMVFVRDSAMLTVLNIIGVILLLLIIARLSKGDGLKAWAIADYLKILLLPLGLMYILFPPDSAVRELFSKNKDKATMLQIKRGILFTIPVIFIFVLLFSSADLIFQKYLNQIFAYRPDLASRLFWIILTTFAFTGFYSYMFYPRHAPKERPKAGQSQFRLGHIESSILFGSVDILFFIFILVQLTYLFGGQSNITSEGFTYAEYARRGFWELLMVAIITLVLLLTAEKNIRPDDSGHTIGFKSLSTFLVILVIAIMASAFMRLLLYEQAYGFTTLRLYSHAFVILLAVVFLFVLFKIYYDRRESSLAFRIFVSMVLFLAVMNLLNPDSFIAARNIERYRATGKVDVGYLGRLSDDAVPVLVRAIESEGSDKFRPLIQELEQRHADETGLINYNGWQSLCLSRILAQRQLAAKISELDSMMQRDQE